MGTGCFGLDQSRPYVLIHVIVARLKCMYYVCMFQSQADNCVSVHLFTVRGMQAHKCHGLALNGVCVEHLMRTVSSDISMLKTFRGSY